MDLSDTWALLWSQSQCALHVERLYDTLHKGRRALAEDRRMDYVPVAIGTRAQVDAAAEAMRPGIRLRCENRSRRPLFPTTNPGENHERKN